MVVPAPAKRLLDFIASKEAPKGYDTVYANKMARMPKPLSSMTIDEAIANGPFRTRTFGSSACGRYQFMQATLTALKATLRLTGREVMAPAFQDELGYQLLKQRGYAAFMAGTMSVTAFGLAIAKEWASFPVLAATKGAHRQVARGQSYYAGDGLNKSLVSAASVEQALQAVRATPPASAVTISPVPIALPRAETVQAPTAAEAKAELPFWARWLTKKPKAQPADRPGLKRGGSPELYDAQVLLRARSYYTKIPPDGLDGPITQAAVAQARKDNGLGDGGIDVAFISALPSMPNRLVPASLAGATLREAAQTRPELFNPVKWLGGLGAGAIGLGGADGSGLLDNVQVTVGKANDVFGGVQTAFSYVAWAVGFLVEHRTLLLIAGGAFLVFKAVGYALDAWIKVRQAFF